MQVTTRTWIERAQDVAVGFGGFIAESFVQRLAQVTSLAPEDNTENRILAANTLVDGLLGGAVMVITDHAGCSQQTEDAIVEGVRQKFKRVRAVQMGAKQDLVNVEKTEGKGGGV